MGVFYWEAEKLLTLETKNTTYQMQIDPYGFLRHQYYGRRIERENLSYINAYYDRGFSGNPYELKEERRFSLDVAPQEYTTCGVGDYRISSVEVVNPDGSMAADWRYVSHEIKAGKYSIPAMPAMYDNGGEAETLVVTLQDYATKLTLKLYYGVFFERDIITRAAEIINTTEGTVELNRAMSMCLDIPFGNWDLMHFYGRHCSERQMERNPLTHSIQTIASKRGTTSHHHNNFVILCDRDANEEYGACYGFMLVYSGNHKTEVEVDQIENTRLVMGISDDDFNWALAQGEAFHTPEVMMTYSDTGFTKLSHNYHAAIRYNVCRGKYQLARRPVLINNWEATYFDFDTDKILGIARQAADLGVELLVLDDGWFGNRNDDNRGLGDWFVNEQKLVGGLAPMIEKINDMGLKFGIWVEPEMVNEDSNLYREHPDWALTIPNRRPTMGRNQMVLDMSRADVREYLWNCLYKLLSENNIEYVKWDMNRCLTDVYSKVASRGEQGKVMHKYVLGVYELQEKLVSTFPNILLENCSGGGGRFDAGMMYYSPQIWCSDDTDAVERLRIQYGTSFAYPVSTMGAHVSAIPNHQTGRTTPLHTRGVVAMSGTFGYELDPNKFTEEEKVEIRHQIAEFKRFYWLIQDGLYYRISNPIERDSYDAWEFVAKDASEALLNLVVTRVQPNSHLLHVKLKGLDPTARYVIDADYTRSGLDENAHMENIYGAIGEGREDRRVYSGSALMSSGYTFPLMAGDYPAVQVHFVKVN